MDDYPFGSPLSAVKVDRTLRLLGLSSSGRVIDFRCGNGELLVRACEQYGSSGVGVDTSSDAIREAKQKASARCPRGSVVFHEADASRFAVEGTVALAVCLGSTHAFGGFRQTLGAIKRSIHASGHLLVGDIYWKQEPSPDYLKVLGESGADHLDHKGNVSAGVAEGLVPLYTAVSSEDDWDHFEGSFWHRKLTAAAALADPAQRAEATNRILRWQGAYLKWGRATMGFGLYLFGNSLPAST